MAGLTDAEVGELIFRHVVGDGIGVGIECQPDGFVEGGFVARLKFLHGGQMAFSACNASVEILQCLRLNNPESVDVAKFLAKVLGHERDDFIERQE